MRALKEYQHKLVEQKVSVFVRRGGPNYQEGLRLMREVGEFLQIVVVTMGIWMRWDATGRFLFHGFGLSVAVWSLSCVRACVCFGGKIFGVTFGVIFWGEFLGGISVYCVCVVVVIVCELFALLY